MADDPRFFFDFRVRLPTPAAARATLFFANAVTRRDLETERLFDALENRFVENVLDFDDFVRFFRFKIKFSHRNLRAEFAAADAARRLVFRRAHGVSAFFADVAVFPRPVTVTLFFHRAFSRFRLDFSQNARFQRSRSRREADGERFLQFQRRFSSIIPNGAAFVESLRSAFNEKKICSAFYAQKNVFFSLA